MAATASTAIHTQLHRVQTFLAVVELGTYTKAADYLNISKAMASLHVKALEEALSITLLVRSTRSVALTESGQQFYDEFKQIFGHIEAAFDNAQHGSRRLRGQLRISTTAEFGERYVLPLIPQFVQRYPGIAISHDANSSLSDLVAEKLDLVVRLGSLADSSLKSRKLADYEIWLVASPRLTGLQAVQQPQDLADLPWIANSNLDSPTHWVLASAQGQQTEVQGRAAHQSNSSSAIRALALAGLGVAVLPDWLVQDDVRNGQLQRVLPEYALPNQPIHLVFPGSRHLPRKTRVFIDFLAGHLVR
ncbi:LysR family transcriptional regulator [Comamonas testosteroni]|uniref:LysR family transcriptional regulator n=1 Tax=Comamonas testosteroni TaxID=285 RepID=A0A0L7N2M7_COMTE|nr:LysR family transcriptional regulator [Comamonas testosteroni]KOC28437.1 LysR family transcriptional regulator [Comamonas testosteroni]KWT68782.1 LysR-family transcriptional regulator [Comamonas testosteroni]